MNRLSPRNNAVPLRPALLIVTTLVLGGGARLLAFDAGPTPEATAIVLPEDTLVSLSEPSPDDGSAAQTVQETEKTPGPTRSFLSTLVHNLGDDVKHLPRRNSVYWVAGGAVLSLAVHPADKSVNRHLLGSKAWDDFFIPGKTVGATEVQVAAGLLTYGIGRYRGADQVRHLGMDLIEAQLLTEGLVEVMKAVGRRPRPLNPDGTPNSTTSFSFPSGHAAVTFAGATVLQQHLGWKAAVPTYLIASYVAMSRLHDNRHYLSDVVFGAATGVIVGRAVTWHGRNNYPVAPAVGPDFLGLTVEWR
jgi:membrane-associated phospholipid phosphatase